MFHLYVDPIYGDDVLAMAQNPSHTGTALTPFGRPLQLHPVDPVFIPGYLQHAPYSFRTVTKAIEWIEALPDPTGRGIHLPYPNTVTNRTVEEIVIHCLPGLYGPKTDPLSSADEIDPLSGLPWNGEAFPIYLPGRVSIQGTSALDTIFDARGYVERIATVTNQTIFGMGEPLLTGQVPLQDYDRSFIDSITMRGCRHVVAGQLSGSAVKIDLEAPVATTISNCFIYGNDIGIALWYVEEFHIPLIVNNTIAFNYIGIWSGSHTTPRAGRSEPTLLNNIIDAVMPPQPEADLPPYLRGVGAAATQPSSCLEGISRMHLRVASKDSCSLGSSGLNFNAYQTSRVNMGITWPFGQTSFVGNAPADEVFDLESLTTVTQPFARGDVYICDVFRNDLTFGGPPFIAQHDFRLAPIVRAPGGGTSTPSPLVNRGIEISPGAPGSIHMETGREIQRPPGNQSEGNARFDAWDLDCDGFGNPRIAPRRMGPGQNPPMFPVYNPCAGEIDLGADELGEVIVSGFVDSTRIFSRSATAHSAVAPKSSQIGTRDRLVFFNVHDSSLPNNVYWRPSFNLVADSPHTVPIGRSSAWFGQLTVNTNPYTADPTQNYTDGTVDQGIDTTRKLLVGQSQYGERTSPPFMRNLVCDISPHLLFDLTPDPDANVRESNYAEHGFQHIVHPTPVRDVFDANPWYHSAVQSPPFVNDNHRLYTDTSTNKRVESGTIHPPLTTTNDPSPTVPAESYLFRNDPALAAHPHDIYLWDFTPSQTGVYDVGPRGWGITGAPPGEVVPFILSQDWHGIRVNLELFHPESPVWTLFGDPTNNVQTFLIVQGAGTGVPTVPTGGTRSAAPTLPSARSGTPTCDRILDAMRRGASR